MDCGDEQIKAGTRVVMRNDGDNGDGLPGTVAIVHRSGRLTVDVDAGGFRNLRKDQVEVQR